MNEKKQWQKNKYEYNKNYDREKGCKIGLALYDEHLLAVWRAIPNKAEWFREKLREYEKENSGS